MKFTHTLLLLLALIPLFGRAETRPKKYRAVDRVRFYKPDVFECVNLFDMPMLGAADKYRKDDLKRSETQQLHFTKSLTEILAKRKPTAKEAATIRNAMDAGTLKPSVNATVSQLAELLQGLKKDRASNLAPYNTMTQEKMDHITQTLEDHIALGKKMIARERMSYQDAIFYLYRGNLLTYFMRAEQWKSIPADALEPMTIEQIYDWIDNSKTYSDALNYSQHVKTDLTQNFQMLHEIMQDPVLSLFFMKDMPELSELDNGLLNNIMYVTFLSDLATFHRAKNYPPFSMVFHDIVHAHSVLLNLKRVYKLRGFDPENISLQEALNTKLQIKRFLRDLYHEKKRFPGQEDLFELAYNYLAQYYFYGNDNLYFHPMLYRPLRNPAERSRMVMAAMDIFATTYEDTYHKPISDEETQKIHVMFKDLIDFGVEYDLHPESDVHW